jgi:hypothetical protein
MLRPFVSFASSEVQSVPEEIGIGDFGIGGGALIVASNGFVDNGLALERKV